MCITMSNKNNELPSKQSVHQWFQILFCGQNLNMEKFINIHIEKKKGGRGIEISSRLRVPTLYVIWPHI